MVPATPILVGPADESDLEWIRTAVERHFGGEPIVTISGVYWLVDLVGLKVLWAGEPKGFLHFKIADKACEIVTLVSLEPGRGYGDALIAALAAHARQAGCHRLWLTATKDNKSALAFYQNISFRIVRVHCGAMAKVRALKPHIPLIGEDGVPLEDFLELELNL